MGGKRRIIAERYDLIESIGRGSFASVWIAWDRRSGEWVAVKILREAGEEPLHRFISERGMLVENANILAPLDGGFDGPDAYIVLPLIRGGTLGDLIADEAPLSPGAVAVITSQLAHGLDGIHREGIVHRDIQPSNILLEPTGDRAGDPHAYITDFGYAVRSDSFARFSAVPIIPGTPGYRAPEVCRGDDATFTSDVFSLGVLAYEAATGQMISAQGESNPPRGAVAFGDPTLLPREGLPDDLWSVIEDMLALDPAARPDAAEVQIRLAAIPPGTVHVLQHVEYPSDIDLSVPDGPGESDRGPLSRRQVVLASLVALVVVAVLAALIARVVDGPAGDRAAQVEAEAAEREAAAKVKAKAEEAAEAKAVADSLLGPVLDGDGARIGVPGPLFNAISLGGNRFAAIAGTTAVVAWDQLGHLVTAYEGEEVSDVAWDRNVGEYWVVDDAQLIRSGTPDRPVEAPPGLGTPRQVASGLNEMWVLYDNGLAAFEGTDLNGDPSGFQVPVDVTIDEIATAGSDIGDELWIRAVVEGVTHLMSMDGTGGEVTDHGPQPSGTGPFVGFPALILVTPMSVWFHSILASAVEVDLASDANRLAVWNTSSSTWSEGLQGVPRWEKGFGRPSCTAWADGTSEVVWKLCNGNLLIEVALDGSLEVPHQRALRLPEDGSHATYDLVAASPTMVWVSRRTEGSINFDGSSNELLRFRISAMPDTSTAEGEEAVASAPTGLGIPEVCEQAGRLCVIRPLALPAPVLRHPRHDAEVEDQLAEGTVLSVTCTWTDPESGEAWQRLGTNRWIFDGVVVGNIGVEPVLPTCEDDVALKE